MTHPDTKATLPNRIGEGRRRWAAAFTVTQPYATFRKWCISRG
jgi:hypothetical protein